MERLQTERPVSAPFVLQWIVDHGARSAFETITAARNSGVGKIPAVTEFRRWFRLASAASDRGGQGGE